MIKHAHNQYITSDFETKICLKIDDSTGSLDKENKFQLDSNQLVKCLYLCDELKMVTDGVCHLYSDGLFC